MSDLKICTLPELQTLSSMLTQYFSELQKQKESVIMVMNNEGDKFKFDYNTLLNQVTEEMKKVKEKIDELNVEIDVRVKATLGIEMDIKGMSKSLMHFSNLYREFKKSENVDYKKSITPTNA